MPDQIYPPKFNPQAGDTLIAGTISAIFAANSEYSDEPVPALTVDTTSAPHSAGDEIVDYTPETVDNFRTFFITWAALRNEMLRWHEAAPIEIGERIRIEMTGVAELSGGRTAYRWSVDFPGRADDARPVASGSSAVFGAALAGAPTAAADTTQPSGGLLAPVQAPAAPVDDEAGF